MTKAVLITGVLGGIGSATAELFHREGFTVFGADVRAEPVALPSWLSHYVQADVGSADDSARLFERVREHTAHLDAIVNNAALQLCKPLVETTPEQWDSVLSVNLRSAFLSARHGYSLLRDRGGAIVNVSSVHAIATSANIGAYAASKGGLVALTRALAIELAKDSIRVNAVLPGAVDTPMLRAGLVRDDSIGAEEDRFRALSAKHLGGRVGQPQEIAEAILFLATERSSFMTGQSLVIDGGATCRLGTE